MEKAYDLKVLAKRLEDKGLKNAEALAGDIYITTRDWAKESAHLSPNPWDDMAVPFYKQLDEVILPQIDAIYNKKA